MKDKDKEPETQHPSELDVWASLTLQNRRYHDKHEHDGPTQWELALKRMRAEQKAKEEEQ
mgnify:FL=1